MTDIEWQWGPWTNFTYQKVHWFYNHRDWTAHYKHFMTIGPLYLTWKSIEHGVKR